MWKFDPFWFEKIRIKPFEPLFADVRCPWTFMRGEFSEVVPPEAEAYFDEKLGRKMPFIEVPQARHHLVLDQPLAFITALRAILEEWGHRAPSKDNPAH